MKSLTDKIWYTYKARIRASERLQSNDTHSQYLLVWYALITTALSIINIRYPEILGSNTDISSAVMSVALLVVSLLVTNTDYRGRAIQMRKNYLDLQHLYNSLLSQMSLLAPTQEMANQYATLLSDSENHLSIDDKYWRVMITKAANLSRPAAKQEYCIVYTYILIRISYLLVLYLLPLLAGLSLLHNK